MTDGFEHSARALDRALAAWRRGRFRWVRVCAGLRMAETVLVMRLGYSW